MLDTNIVSHFVRKQSKVDKRIVAVAMEAICISAVTEGELLFGLIRRPANKTLALEVNEFLSRVDVLPWDRAAAANYAGLRAQQERKGKILAPIDLLIAAHAISADAILVTNDTVFGQITGLTLEDWTKPI